MSEESMVFQLDTEEAGVCVWLHMSWGCLETCQLDMRAFRVEEPVISWLQILILNFYA